MDADVLEGVTLVSDEEEDTVQEPTIIQQQSSRPSKGSVSSIASSVYEASATGDHAAEQLSSPKGEVMSPRIAELRLDVMVGSSLASRRESSDSPLRGLTRVSPNSPRKMLTPVSGNCDFQGMIPAHHARRLSSRSASSPRLIISGFSPKQSPKDSPVKVSPRDLLLPNNAPKIPSKLPPSPPATGINKIVSTGDQQSPSRPPTMPSVKIKADRRAVSSEERRSEKRPAVALTTTELVLLRGGPNPSPPHHRQTKSDTPAPTVLPGYPLQPSLESRKAAFEKLHVQVVRRGHVGSNDGMSDRDSLSIVTGSQADSLTRSPSRMKKSLYTRRVLRIRRHSDPCLSFTSPWPRYIKPSTRSTLDMPAPVQFVGESRRLGLSSDAIRPTPVRAPSPATTSSTCEPSQPPSPSPSPASIVSSSPPAPVPSSRFISSMSVAELATEDFDVPQYAREARHDSVLATMSISDAPSPPSPFLTGQAEEIPSLSSHSQPILEEEEPMLLPRRKRSSILSNLSSPLKDGLLGRATSPRLPSLRRKSRAQSVQSPPSPALPLVASPGLPPPSSPPQPRPARLAPFEKATSSSSIFGRSGRGRSKSPIRNLSHTTGSLATQSAPSQVRSRDAPEMQLVGSNIATGLPTPAAQPRGSLLGSRASSMPNQQHQRAEEDTAAPMRKSSSFATATASSIASSLFPVVREKSPTSSPTTRSKRRPSFNFTAFDATVAALKQKFRRKNSTSGGTAGGQKTNAAFAESVSTPNSPVYDRRTMPSNSMNSLYSETSEDGHFSTAATNAAPSKRRETRLGTSNTAQYHMENRRNSDAADSILDQEDTSDSDIEASFKAGGYVDGTDDEEEEPVAPKKDLDDPALACVLKVGTVEDILRSIGQVQIRKKRLELFDALFLNSSDFLDPSGEQMTSKVVDYVEDSGDLDALERWLIEFRGMDKLRFYDPSVTARVREVIDSAVAAMEEKELARAATLKTQEEDGRLRMVSATSPRASVRPNGEPMEVEETSSVVRVMEVVAPSKADHVVEEDQDQADLPIEDSGSDGRPYETRQGRSSRFSSLSSSSGSDDEDEGEDASDEDEDQQKRRIGLRMLRLLNRNDALDVADVTAGANDWALDLDETRHGGLRRRKSETDIPAMAVGAEEEEAPPVHPRRAYSLPFLLLWSHPSTIAVGVDARRRELSTGSYGSFSARSSSFHSSSAALESILRQRELEDEERDTMCMLGLQPRDASPLPQPLKSSSSDALSLSLHTNPASPLSPTMLTMMPPPVRSLSASQNFSLALQPQHQQHHRRTLSIGEDSTTQYFYYASSQQSTSAATVLMTLGRGTEDSSADDTTTATAISPRSLDAQQLSSQQQQRRMTASSIATAASSSTNAGARQRTHVKQPSSSSLQPFRSTSGRSSSQPRSHSGRRSVVSSSFSSFVFMEAETFTLPEPSSRGDIKRYDPHLVAEQLTMTMCRTAYFRITPTALRTTDTRKRDEAVQRMMRYFEILSTWPVTEILSDPRRRASERIDDFGFFVALAQACREAGNYHAVFALVGGLQSPLLIWVTEIAHRRDKKRFASLKRLVRTDNNYRVYHADLSKRSLKRPCIPYLGLLNRSLVALQCDAPVFLDSEQRLVNFARCSRIFSAIHDYLKWQSKSNVVTSASTAMGRGSPFLTRQMRNGGGGVAGGLSGTHAFPSSGIFLDPCIRKALADNMARSVLDYRELSSMSAEAKSWYLKSVRQRAFHRARVLGHQIVQVGNE